MHVDIDNLVWELKSVATNNFTGSPSQRFKQAKRLILSMLGEVIDDNQTEIIGHLKECKC